MGGACGIWGVIAVSLFDINNFGVGGDLYGPGISLTASLIAQCMGFIVITIWSGVLSAIMLVIIKALGLLRVDEEHEKMGLDAAEFSPKAAYRADMFGESMT